MVRRKSDCYMDRLVSQAQHLQQVAAAAATNDQHRAIEPNGGRKIRRNRSLDRSSGNMTELDGFQGFSGHYNQQQQQQQQQHKAFSLKTRSILEVTLELLWIRITNPFRLHTLIFN